MGTYEPTGVGIARMLDCAPRIARERSEHRRIRSTDIEGRSRLRRAEAELAGIGARRRGRFAESGERHPDPLRSLASDRGGHAALDGALVQEPRHEPLARGAAIVA